jgi:uracil-DNA glycosylase family 4
MPGIGQERPVAPAEVTGSAAGFVPERPTLERLREAVQGCRGCGLYEHATQGWREVAACRPWLDADLAIVEPRLLVCLGATAAQALLGRQFRVTQHRGRLVESDLAELVTATVHPSSILRAPDAESRRAELEAFVDDLRVVASLLS